MNPVSIHTSKPASGGVSLGVLSYDDYIESKSQNDTSVVIDIEPDEVNPMLFPFQRDLVVWALKKGRAAIFADCGLGKTFMQLEWARFIGNVLIVAPLAVSSRP